MEKIIDIACNFTSHRFDNDLEDVINKATNTNVSKFVLLCSSLQEIKKLSKIYSKYNNLMYLTLGVHPHNASEFKNHSSAELSKLVEKHSPSAIGEIGLDFYRNISSFDEQIFAFEEQIKIAIKKNLPLYLHQRDSHKDFINILEKYKGYYTKAVVHCFTGTKKELDDYLNLDCSIGITGWICDKERNKNLRKTIKNIPLSSLMIETDCPYLTPKNMDIKPKNNRNEPKYLNHIVREISNIMNVDESIIRKTTFENTQAFFN